MPSIHIDLMRLNVLYKDGTFCLALNYKSLESFVLDAQSFANSFDVYLCLWPRTKEEGDYILNDLSIGGVPFYVCKAELDKVIDTVKAIPGVAKIYLCNIPANIVTVSRVDNFRAVFKYGDRFALVEAKEKMLASLKILPDKKSVAELDTGCYGDIDVISLDSVVALNSEFGDVKRESLAVLAPLIVSENSPYKIEYAEDIETESKEIPTPPDTEPASDESSEEPVSEPMLSKKEERKNVKKDFSLKARAPIDKVCLALTAVSCVTFVFIGFGIGVTSKDTNSTVSFLREQQDLFLKESVATQTKIATFNRGPHVAGDTADLLSFVAQSGANVQISAVDVTTNSVMLNFLALSEDDKNSFVEVLSQNYVVGGVNELSTVANTDGTVSYEYSVTLAPST